MIWLFFINVIIASLFTYIVYKHDELRYDKKFITIATIIAITTVMMWIIRTSRFMGSTLSYGQGVVSGVIIVGSITLFCMIWGLFYGVILTEQIPNFIAKLIGGSGEVIKEYDKAKGFEINAKYPQAIEAYLEYLEEDPEDYKIFERIAKCYYKQNKPVDAIESLQKTFPILKKNSNRHSNEKKREEFARILFLDKKIRLHFHLKLNSHYEDHLKTLCETRFGKANRNNDPIMENYLEVWSDI